MLPVVGVLCKDELRGAWALPVADATVAGWLGIEAAVMLGASWGGWLDDEPDPGCFEHNIHYAKFHEVGDTAA